MQGRGARGGYADALVRSGDCRCRRSGAILTAIQGKGLTEAEIVWNTAYPEWSAGEAERIRGEIISGAYPSQRIPVLKQPIGICAAITPWNFPNGMIMRDISAITLLSTIICIARSPGDQSRAQFMNEVSRARAKPLPGKTTHQLASSLRCENFRGGSAPSGFSTASAETIAHPPGIDDLSYPLW